MNNLHVSKFVNAKDIVFVVIILAMLGVWMRSEITNAQNERKLQQQVLELQRQLTTAKDTLQEELLRSEDNDETYRLALHWITRLEKENASLARAAQRMQVAGPPSSGSN